MTPIADSNFRVGEPRNLSIRQLLVNGSELTSTIHAAPSDSLDRSLSAGVHSILRATVVGAGWKWATLAENQ